MSKFTDTLSKIQSEDRTRRSQIPSKIVVISNAGGFYHHNPMFSEAKISYLGSSKPGEWLTEKEISHRHVYAWRTY